MEQLWKELQYFVSHYRYIPEITPKSALFRLFNIDNQKQNLLLINHLLLIFKHFQSVQNGVKTFDNIQKITTDYLLNYPYFKKYCKMIAIDLSKQRALDTDPKAYSNNLILLKI